MLLEAADGIGGRVRTDVVDGFKLDRGFAIFLTSYPETQVPPSQFLEQVKCIQCSCQELAIQKRVADRGSSIVFLRTWEASDLLCEHHASTYIDGSRFWPASASALA